MYQTDTVDVKMVITVTSGRERLLHSRICHPSCNRNRDYDRVDPP